MRHAIWQWILTPSNQVLLLALVLAFTAGLLLGFLLMHRRARRTTSLAREGDRAFFKGVQHILSNDHDQAIEQFTKAVQVNSETIETYVALGNLYRSKGDIDRAIRIRRNIILRPQIDEAQRTQALFDLGLDYRKGGFLDRALETFSQVLQKTPSNLAALEEVEKIYEDLKDWENAFHTRQRIAKLAEGDHGHILAHHKTEEGKAWFDQGDTSKAVNCYKKALSMDASCVDAYLHLGDAYQKRDDMKKAIATWKKIVAKAPAFTFLAYGRLEGVYSRIRNLKPVEDFLKECAETNDDAFTRLALAQYLHKRGDPDGAVRELEKALTLDPAFFEARALLGRILIEQERVEDVLEAYRHLLDHLGVSRLEFQCTYCGYRPADLQWQCPQCRRWDIIARMESKERQGSGEPALEGVPALSEGPGGEIA